MAQQQQASEQSARSKDALFRSAEAIAFDKRSVEVSDVDKQRMGKDSEDRVLPDVPSDTDYH